MRRALRIARREYLATVRTKGFIIGLVVAPVLFGGSALAMWLLEDQVDTRDKAIAIVDRSGLVAETVEAAAARRNAVMVYDSVTGEKVRPAFIVETLEPNDADPAAQRLELSNRVRSRELHAFVEIGGNVLHPRMDTTTTRIGYYAKSAAMDDVRRWVERPINNRLRQLRLSEAGVDPRSHADMFDWVSAGPMSLVSIDPETGEVRAPRRTSEAEAILAPLVMPMLMFLLMMMGAVPLLNAVMEEKSQRIAEVVLGSARPFEFMLGKVMGGLGVALTAATVYIAAGVIAISQAGWGEHIPFHVLPWFFTYTLVATVMLGSMYAAIGSLCNDPSEAQNVMFPVMLPMMIPMFVLVPVVKEPESAFAVGMSLFPLFTPMLMLIRQTVLEGLPLWQPVVALTGMIMFTTFTVWAGGRVFRVAILLQGTPPKLGNLVRWAVRG
jgi:ABC-2 type transport system permease protein